MLCGKSSKIYLVGAFSAIGGFLFGYHTGVISGVLLMEDFRNMTTINQLERNRKGVEDISSNYVTGSIVGIVLFGCLIGSLIGGQASDRFSRKYSIAAFSILFSISTALETASFCLPGLLTARLFAGISIGALSTIVPIYHSEISETKIRGRIITLQQWAITIGLTTSFWANYVTNDNKHLKNQSEEWRIPFGSQILPALILSVGIFFCPFSPRWLISQDLEDEARKVLMDIRSASSEEIEDEIDRIRNEVARLRENEMVSYYQLFRAPLRRSFLLGIGIQILQQFTGINAIIYYAPIFFNQTLNFSNSNDTLLDSPLMATGIFGCIGIILTIPTIIYIDRLGRRILLISGAAIMSISMLIVAILLPTYGKEYDIIHAYVITDHKIAVIVVVFIYVFVGGFSYSWGPIPWIFCAEIFPVTMRAKAASFTTAANWASNFLISFLVPILYNKMQYGMFIMFSIFCASMVGIVYLFYPETKDKHLEHRDMVESKRIFVPEWLENTRVNYNRGRKKPIPHERSILFQNRHDATDESIHTYGSNSTV